LSFNLSEYHRGKQEEFRHFSRVVVAPEADRRNKEGLFPRDVLNKMAERGYLGLPFPEEWGGAGEDFLSYILFIEEVSRSCASTGGIVSVHTSVGTYPIYYFGTPSQKNAFLYHLASGKYLGAFALTEEQAGSDPAALRTTAIRKGDYYYLNGSKTFITSGGEADLYVVFANVDPSLRKRGITSFIMEKNTSGFKPGKSEKKMGLLSSPTTELILEDACIPASNRLGEEGEGLKIALSLLEGGRIGIGAQALGIAGVALDTVIDLAPGILKNYGAALAELYTRLEGAKLLVYRAASLKNQNQACRKEASMAKMAATDLAVQVAQRAIDFAGYLAAGEKTILERLFRDAKVTQIYEGTNQIQRAVIARELLSN